MRSRARGCLVAFGLAAMAIAVIVGIAAWAAARRNASALRFAVAAIEARGRYDPASFGYVWLNDSEVVMPTALGDPWVHNVGTGSARPYAVLREILHKHGSGEAGLDSVSVSPDRQWLLVTGEADFVLARPNGTGLSALPRDSEAYASWIGSDDRWMASCSTTKEAHADTASVVVRRAGDPRPIDRFTVPVGHPLAGEGLHATTSGTVLTVVRVAPGLAGNGGGTKRYDIYRTDPTRRWMAQRLGRLTVADGEMDLSGGWSPAGDRLAIARFSDDVPGWKYLLHRYWPRYWPEPRFRIALLVGRADGTQMRELGTLPRIPVGADDYGVRRLQWLPDGKHVSLLVGTKLYVLRVPD